MVAVMGHLAFGLLAALPAWVLWDGRVSVAFVGLVTSTSLLPDVDLLFGRAFPAAVHHHGVTHTVVFVTAASLVAGALVAAALARPFDRWTPGTRFDAVSLFAFASTGFLLGGLSHLFADLLSAPDGGTPLEPFWPFLDKPWAVDVVWYDAAWVNLGLLVVAVLLHLAVVAATEPLDHRFRLAAGR